jgi:hypothetical protein
VWDYFLDASWQHDEHTISPAAVNVFFAVFLQAGKTGRKW